MTETDYRELRKLAEAATPGPWINDADGCVGKTYIEGGKTTICTCPLLDMKKNGRADAAFIAAANPQTILALTKRAEELEGENGRLREALTPSAETKAAYIGEFSVPLPEQDEDGNEVMRKINVPWTTIKDIMAAIASRALSALPTGGENE